MTSASKQISDRQEPRHQFLIHDSFCAQCSILQQISCRCQFEQTNMIPMSRSEVDALKKDECLQLMEHLGEAQLRRGVLVVELKAMLKVLLLSKEGEQEKSLLEFAKMTRSQLADKERQLQIPMSENHTRGHFVKITRENLMQQSTPKGSNYLGFGKHGAKTYQEVLQLDLVRALHGAVDFLQHDRLHLRLVRELRNSVVAAEACSRRQHPVDGWALALAISSRQPNIWAGRSWKRAENK